MAGYRWQAAFMKRHPKLSLRTPELTSINRVKSFCKANVDVFFNNLEKVLETTPYEANSIWNMDETGFSTVPSKIGKVISLKGMKRVGLMAAQERGTMITMALAVSASGNSIPPFFLFPRKNMLKTLMFGTSSGSVGLANESGWMQQPQFVRFMEHFIKYSGSSKDSPTLLLLDNHSSHLSVEAIDMANENGVTLLSFPPHCSHRMQPLDVSVYGPVKTYYKSQCKSWNTAHANEALEIGNIPALACAALDKALVPQTIKSGFKSTGVSPFDRDVFTDADFIEAVNDDEAKEAEEVENRLDDDHRRRICLTTQLTTLDLEVAANEEVYSSNLFGSRTASPAFSIPSQTSSLSSSLNDLSRLRSTTPNLPSRPSTALSFASETGSLFSLLNDFGELRPTSSAVPSPVLSNASQDSLSSILSDIGPLKASQPRKKSNRGRKPMQSAILTSPENMSKLKETRAKRDAAKAKKEANAEKKKGKLQAEKPAKKPKKALTTEIPSQEATAKKVSAKKTPAKKALATETPPKEAVAKKTLGKKAKTKKRPRKRSSSSSSDIPPYCMECGEDLPDKLTCQNSVKCTSCGDFAHFNCVDHRHNYFICKDCDSTEDFDDESD